MELFYRRPLALVCAAFIGASLAGFYINSTAKLAAALITAAALGAVLLLCLRRKQPDRKRRRERGAAVLSVFAAAAALTSLLSSFCYFDMKYMPLQGYIGYECEVEGTVIARRYSNRFSTGYEVDIKSLNGEKRHFSAVLDCAYVSDLQSGYAFRATVTPAELGYGEYDSADKRSALSDGLMIRLISASDSDCDIVAEDVFNLRVSAASLNRRLTTALEAAVGGEEGNLAAALSLGQRDEISDETARDFRRSGASHLLALSGMHMAVVMGICDLILRRLNMSKSVRCVILLGMMLFYLALTGFSVSASRAAIMLALVYLSFLFSSQTDTLTSLFVAGVIILTVSPSAVADTGFWLSFAATLGIVVGTAAAKSLTSPLYKANGKRRRGIGKGLRKGFIKSIDIIITALIATLAANAATALIVWRIFGEISLLTLITNLCLPPLATLLLALTILFFCFSWQSAIAGVSACFIRITAGLMLRLAEGLASLPGGVVSLRYAFAGVIIVLMTASLTVLTVIRLKRKLIIGVPVLAAALAFIVCLGAYEQGRAEELDVTYLHSGKNEALIVTKSGGAVICDISDGSYSNIKLALDAAHKGYATEVEALVLTHYHQKHISSVYRLMCSEKVDRIWLPEPVTDSEYSVMWSIVYYADACGSRVSVYGAGEPLCIFGEAEIRVQRDYIKRSTHPVIGVGVGYGEDELLYLGGSLHESVLYEKAAALTADCENIIFGIHGPVIKTRYSYPYGSELTSIIFSDDNIMSHFDYESTELYGVTLIRAPLGRTVTLSRRGER